jgi:hypothetical protein
MSRNICARFVAAWSMLVVAALAIAGYSREAYAAESGAAYNVLEVARFEVNREDFSTKESERAGRISDETLETIQRILITEFSRMKLLPTVRKPVAAGDPGTVLELGGKLVDWMPGDASKRMMIGYGAGQQKIEVDCVLKDRATGTIIAHERILDRKIAGVSGGSEDKGMRDFAEKVAKFMHVTLDPIDWKAPPANP